MTAPRARRPLVRAAAFGALAAALVAAACEAPHPLQPSLDGTRRVYAAPGSERVLPRSPVGMQAAVARYFPDVARHGLPADQALVFVLSSAGEFLRHDVVRTGVPDPAHPLGERELTDVIRTIAPDSVRSVDVMLQPAGVLGPTPTRVVWVALKRQGDLTNELSISGSEAAATAARARTFPKSFHVSTYAAPGSGRYVAATGADADNPGASVDAAAVHAAMLRYYTPRMAAAGLTGEARVEYTVDARGRLTHTDVYAKPESLQPVARAVIESLSFPGGAKPATAMLMMRFEPSLVNGH